MTIGAAFGDSFSAVGASLDPPAEQNKLGNLETDDFASNESKIIPIGAGRLIVPALWVGQAYNQFTKDAPDSRPGKK